MFDRECKDQSEEFLKENTEDNDQQSYKNTDEDSCYSRDNGSNFFFRMTGLVSKDKINQLENKLKEYEKQIEKLKETNNECMNKIQNYECQNILEFNRKIRSGIPIKFFPCHSVYGLIEKKQSIKRDHSDYDLH
jgi:hypothetical protein